MATSKSTVLGLRLDHDRRAWVEGEAARRGVTVRVLFEGLIDQAQADRSAGADLGEAPSESATGPGVGEPAAGGFTSAAGSRESAADIGTGSWAPPASGTSPGPDVGSLAELPARLVRVAISLPINILKTSGRCAHKSLEGCPALRSWSSRSR
jgi:hypothetical protein